MGDTTSSPRVILFTGKGGVGKTTVASATALHLSKLGQRVVITSADPAHSLSDVTQKTLGSEPVTIAANCDAQQLDARERFEEHWTEIREWLLELFQWAGVKSIEAEELAVLPGIDELFSLIEVESLIATGDYDTIVVDCAPTAETIRLLALPEMLGWYMDRLFPASRRLTKLVGPLVSRVTALPVASDAVFASGLDFYNRIERVKAVLLNPDITTVRLVLNPERVVVAEARRTHTYLSLFGYHVDAAIINRVLPAPQELEPVPLDSWVSEWRDAQQEQLERIHQDFSSLTLFQAPHSGREIIGISALTEFGHALWHDHDPREVCQHHDLFSLDRNGDEYVLTLELPHVESDDVDLTLVANELQVTIGPYRRHLALPDMLLTTEIKSAKLNHGELRIVFQSAGSTSNTEATDSPPLSPHEGTS